MNPAQLLNHFDRIAEAPDAVPRLRRLILDLAVRGKLVEQDLNDEPASELLKRINAERNARLKIGEIKKPKDLPPVETAPYSAPDGWNWLPLGETGNIFTGNSINGPTRERLERTTAGRPFIATKDVGYGFDPINYDNGLLVADSDQSFRVARSRSVLICAEGGSAGRKIGISDRDISFGNKLLANETWSVILPRYVMFVYLSDFFFDQFAAQMTGIIGGISINKFLQLPFPLPPLAEQHRIVAKVDELMALCDRLEAAQSKREQRRDRLAAASLNRINQPGPSAEGGSANAFREHARFHLDHLPRLTTRPEHIKSLRQTILNLAVRGRLVEQDPNDESGSDLLQRITVERAQLLKAGAVPPHKLNACDATRLTGVLPSSWKLIALGDACTTVTSGSRGWAQYYASSGPGFIRAQNIRFGTLKLDGLALVSPPPNSEGSRTQVSRGDLLIVITGAGVTNPALVDRDLGEAYVSQHVGLARPTFEQLSDWFLLCLMAPAGGRAELVERAYGSGKPGLNLDNIRSLRIPLPPLAEQHRIVAKVHELMAVCDQLEAQLTTTQTDSRRLLDAVLREALAPAAERELTA